MSFKRSTVLIAALALFGSCAPAFANAVHGEKITSQQGNLSDANFTGATSTISGIPVEQFLNTNDNGGTLYDIFQLPASFTAGTSFTFTFSDITAGYGLWSCGAGLTTPVSADNQTMGGTCTAGDNNEGFVSFVEAGNVATLTFLGGAGAPPSYTFWATQNNANGAANLLSIVGNTTNMPEPSSILLLASGLAGLLLLRRRAEA